MDTQGFMKKARGLGFDTVAALSLPEAYKAIAVWKTYVRDESIFKRLTLNPRELMPDVQTVLMLAYPYRTYKGYAENTGRISGYYIASNCAYQGAKKLAEHLQGQGICAITANNLPLKPLAKAAGLGRYGRNGIIVRKGSHIVLSAIVIDFDLELPPVEVPVPDCENCGSCERVCPTGCLKDGYVDAGRCLRTYMTHNLGAIPDDLRSLMGERLVGCDECLNACPGLQYDDVPEALNRLFAWDALRDKDTFEKNKDIIIALLGKNYADAISKSVQKRFVK